MTSDGCKYCQHPGTTMTALPGKGFQEEENEVAELFEAYASGGVVSIRALNAIIGNCSPREFTDALVNQGNLVSELPQTSPRNNQPHFATDCKASIAAQDSSPAFGDAISVVGSSSLAAETQNPPESVDELSKQDLRLILLARAEARRQSNARWIANQKLLGRGTSQALKETPTLPGANEDESGRRDKSGATKQIKHLLIDDANLGDLNDDAEFERILLHLKAGGSMEGEAHSPTFSANTDRTLALSARAHPSAGAGEFDDEAHHQKASLVHGSPLTQAPSIPDTHTDIRLQHLQTKLNAVRIPTRHSKDGRTASVWGRGENEETDDEMDLAGRSRGKYTGATRVNAAILNELFDKNGPKNRTVDDVLKAIDREENFAHGWDDQRRKPGTTVMFVGRERLARKAQHGVMLPEIDSPPRPRGAQPDPPSTEKIRKKYQEDRSNVDVTPVAMRLPEWKQAWLMLSEKNAKSNRAQLAESKKYRHVKSSGIHILSQARPYHLTPMQRAECFDRAASSLEMRNCEQDAKLKQSFFGESKATSLPETSVHKQRQLASVALNALSALTSWQNTNQSLAGRSSSVPPDSTAYARARYASRQ